MAITAYASHGTVTVSALRATLFPEYVDTTLPVVTVAAVSPADVVQVQNIVPEDTATEVAPGRPITFTLLTSARQHVQDFGETLPDDWELATPANGYTHTNWNAGSDNWTILPHDGGYVLRCAGRGFALNQGSERVHLESTVIDFVCRVRWYTGATAGLIARCRYDSYGKVTQGPYVIPGVEIDSGGCRVVLYDNSYARGVKATDAFTPVNGEWYWLRMQVSGNNPCHYRGKAWSGERDDEPGWTIAWQSDTIDVKVERIFGFGLHVESGTAWFDKWEMRGIPSETDRDRLTVAVNTIDHTYADGTVRIDPISDVETFNSVSRSYPNEQNWMVTVYPRLAHDPNDPDQDAVITWDRSVTDITISTRDWDVPNFPVDPPTYDPTTEGSPGDPTRMSNFGCGAGEIIPSGLKFHWFVQALLFPYGYEFYKWLCAPITWVLSTTDFQWVAANPLYGYHDGRYYIGHPVYRDHKSSVVPAELVFEDHKGEVIPKGSLAERFVASVVPQAYFRADFKASVQPSVVLWWEGDASAVVSAETLMELDASGVVFMYREGTVIHFRVVSSTTHAQLMAMGVTFVAPVRATTAQVVLSALHASVIDGSPVATTLGTLTITPKAATIETSAQTIEATLGVVTCSALTADMTVDLTVWASTPTVTVASLSTSMPTIVNSTSDAVTVSALGATVEIANTINTTTDTVTVAGLGASISSAVTVNANLPPVTVTAHAATIDAVFWYNASWNYRFQVEIQSSEVDDDFAAIDILVTEDNVPSGFWSHVDTDGDDLVVTEADGETKLDRDLIRLDTGAQEMVLRFNGAIYSGTDTVFWIYYGNGSATETNSTDTYDSDLQVYWPLEEDPSGTPPQAIDRTANGFDGTANAVDAGDLIAVQVGDGWDLDGSAEYVNDTGCSFSTATMTLMIWVDVDNVSATGQALYVGSSLGGGSRTRTAFQVLSTKKVRLFYFDPSYSYIESTGSYSDKACLVGTLTTSAQELFVDGATTGTPDTSSTRVTDTSADVYGGVGVSDVPALTEYFTGPIDELRVWTRVLSDEEISTRYNNENSPSTFYSCGSEQTKP